MKANIIKTLISFFILTIGVFSFNSKSEAQGTLNYEVLMTEGNSGCINVLCLYNQGNECNSPGSKFLICPPDQ
jgi:hypothetical protein